MKKSQIGLAVFTSCIVTAAAGLCLYGIIRSAARARAENADVTVVDAEPGVVTIGRRPYRLSFPDGSPVIPGRFQEWLDGIKADPEISPEEYAVAAALVKQLRARLN